MIDLAPQIDCVVPFVYFLIPITRMRSSNLSRIVTKLTYCMYAGSQSVMQTLWKHRLVKTLQLIKYQVAIVHDKYIEPVRRLAHTTKSISQQLPG